MTGQDVGGLAAEYLGRLDLGLAMGGSPESEDCLFLDVVVPGKAIRGEAKLPVLNWIYGGAYVLGSKDVLYDGTPFVKASKGNFIYVAGNYRLGSLGFLGGTTMEKDTSVVTNAGFYDQRAVLEWIQKYIVCISNIVLLEIS
jgi:carboxylesterase type B